MITAKDLNLIEKRLRPIFVTKDEFADFREEIKTEFTNLRSDFFNKIDSFVKEVRDSHEERQIMSGQISELYDRVEKLESPKN